MSEELSMQCAVTANNGERVPVKIVSTATPTQVRQLVSEATGIPLSALRLIFRGKMIKDDDSKNAVQEYSLKEGEVLHCMGKPGGAAAAAAPAPPTSTTTPTASTTAGAAPTLSAANTSASAASAPVSLATPTGASGLQAALAKLRTSNPPATYLTAIQTLEKILSNIANNPMEEKYRRMKKSNGAFQKRLGGVPGGADCLLAAGFVSEMKDGEDCFVLQASADAWPQLMASKTAVEAAVQQAKTSAAPPASAAAVPPVNPMGLGGMPGSGFGGMPGGMGAGMPGMNSPQMQQAMRNMMSNPDQLRIMLQNPMVQQMIQNDPRTPPHMRQAMAQLANDPQAINQIAAMMGNPQMQNMLQQQMNGAGGGMGMGGGMPGMFPPTQPSTNANNNSSNNNSGNQDDTSQTEEEMIAEAIRRSLEE